MLLQAKWFGDYFGQELKDGLMALKKAIEDTMDLSFEEGLYFSFCFSVERAVEVWDEAVAEMERDDASRALETLHGMMVTNAPGWIVNQHSVSGVLEHFDRLVTTPVELSTGGEAYVVEPVHCRVNPMRADSIFQQEKKRLAQEVALLRSQHEATAVGGKAETKKRKKHGVETNKKGRESYEAKADAEEVEGVVSLNEEELTYYSLPMKSSSPA